MNLNHSILPILFILEECSTYINGSFVAQHIHIYSVHNLDDVTVGTMFGLGLEERKEGERGSRKIN